MSSYTFEKLLHNSRSLNESLKQNQAPRLEMNLGQLANHSSIFSSKVYKNTKLEQTTQHFLAQKRVNVEKIDEELKKIQSSTIFEPADLITATDIDSYLDCRRKHLFIKNPKKVLVNNNSFTDKKSESFLEKELSGLKIDTSPNKLASYTEVIRELNKMRTMMDTFPLISRLKSLSDWTGATQSHGSSIVDVWDMILYLATQASTDTQSKSCLSQNLIHAARGWLEKQFLKSIDDVLFNYATQIHVGGLPSQSRRILAYIYIMYRRPDKTWIEKNLELQKDIPIWLYIYVLIRAGQIQLAIDFVEVEKNLFHLTPMFPVILQEYFRSPHRLLSEHNQKKVLLEYQIMEYGVEEYDPYKKLLFKILGRCEMNRLIKLNAFEDNVWLQLSHVRECDPDTKNGSEKYNILDLQRTLGFFIEELGKTSVDPWTRHYGETIVDFPRK